MDRQTNLSFKFIHPQKGMSFVEVLVATAIIALVFGGLYTGVQSMLQVIGTSKAKAGATALTIEQLEYIRSLPYDDVGTLGGVPTGLIQPTSTTTLNGITYYGRTLVEYVDDEADGFGGDDENGILADYKRVKVEYSWTEPGATSSLSMVTNIVPIGIETTEGGGTIKVNVFDASAMPVLGAAVRFENNTGTTSIDTVRYTNADGVAYLAGAPALANYEISVSKSGYSVDGTYLPDASNPNPVTPPIAVVESAVSTMNFQIDLLSDFYIETVGVPTENSFADSFDNDSQVESYINTVRTSSNIQLASASSSYVASGQIISATTSPSSLDSWYALNFNGTVATGTELTVSVLYDTGAGLALVPDVDLPGNSTGFASGGVDLQSLDTTTYNTLALRADLSTEDTDFSPILHDWSLDYIEAQSPIANVPIYVRGNKTIGTDGSGNPVYKYETGTNTDGSGELDLIDVEYDTYTVELNTGSYRVVESCPISPVNLGPNSSQTLTLTLDSPVTNQLRVYVSNTSGDALSGATVSLTNTGIDETDQTSLCGQSTFDSGLYGGTDYTVTVSKSGYTTEVINNVTVNSTSTLSVSLTSS